jgi:hypothetical protein
MSNGWVELNRKEALNLKWWLKKKKKHPRGEKEKLNSWHVLTAIFIAYIFYSFGRTRFCYRKTAVSKGSGNRPNEHTALVDRCWYWGKYRLCTYTQHSSVRVTILAIENKNSLPVYFLDTCSQQHKTNAMEGNNGFLLRVIFGLFPACGV